MKFKAKAFWLMVLMASAMAVLTGCQSIRNSNTASKEEMLAAAGFRMQQAQTPQQFTNLQNLPQRKLIPHTKDGRLMYVYADATVCQCVYVGTEGNYQQYQQMAYQKELVDEQESAAAMNEDAASMNQMTALNWEVWGPWGPW